jgi:hypothetical protein
MNNFTNMHIYKVVERNKISAVLSEQNFQLSGNVSDDTIQSIGNMLGAQFVVSGALDDVGRYYRLRLFVIAVETGERKSSTAVNIIKPNKQVVHLLGDVDIIENIPPAERVIGGYMAVFAEIYKILNDKDSPIIYIYPDEASGVIFATREALKDSWMVDYYHDEEYEVKFISGEWVLINKLYNPSFTPSSTSSSRAYEDETFNNLIDSVIDGNTAIAIVQQAAKCYIRIWH